MDQISRAESWITSGDLDKFHETQSHGTRHLFLFHFPVHRISCGTKSWRDRRRAHTLHSHMHINSPDVSRMI